MINTKCFKYKNLIAWVGFVKAKIQDMGVPNKNSYNMQVPLRGEKLQFGQLSGAVWARFGPRNCVGGP